MIHAANVVQNPRWYATAEWAREQINEEYSTIQGQRPAALAAAFATPYTDPMTGYQNWVQMRLPWDAQLKLERDMLSKGPLGGTFAATSYVYNRLWGIPWDFPVRTAIDGIARKKAERLGLLGMALPSKDDKGQLMEQFWGLQPYIRQVEFLRRAFFDPSLWSQMPQMMGQTAVEIAVPLERVQPGGKVYRGI